MLFKVCFVFVGGGTREKPSGFPPKCRGLKNLLIYDRQKLWRSGKKFIDRS